jgi:A49-like RNA polymerase I associated factor
MSEEIKNVTSEYLESIEAQSMVCAPHNISHFLIPLICPQDLRLTPLMLGSLAKELGCKIRKDYSGSSKSNTDGESSVMSFADLTVPLVFPVRRGGRK